MYVKREKGGCFFLKRLMGGGGVGGGGSEKKLFLHYAGVSDGDKKVVDTSKPSNRMF